MVAPNAQRVNKLPPSISFDVKGRRAESSCVGSDEVSRGLGSETSTLPRHRHNSRTRPPHGIQVEHDGDGQERDR